LGIKVSRFIHDQPKINESFMIRAINSNSEITSIC